MSDDDLQITTIRLSPKDLRRAEQLISKVTNVQEFAAIGKVKRGHVLRVAMLRGLDQLEVDFGTDNPD
jgi:hypothetical protein